MIILGVDPGTLFTGYGVIHFDKELKYISSGIIKLSSKQVMAERLEIIYNQLHNVIIQFSPTEFSIETAFFGKNVQSALKIGYARGVSILAAAHNKLSVNEYSPREIKKSIVGSGSSSKEQVNFMVKTLLRLDKEFPKLDESDALASAICHAFRYKSFNTKSGSWKSFIDANPHLIIKG